MPYDWILPRTFSIKGLFQAVILLHLIVLFSYGDDKPATLRKKPPRPSFRSTPKNVTYHRGETAILQCAVDDLEMNKVIWRRKNKKTPISIGELVYVMGNSFEVKHITYKDEWNLFIYNVQPKHAGVYECQVSVKQSLHWRVRLNIIDEPYVKKANGSVSDIVLDGKNVVEKGDKLLLTCNATGVRYPPEDVDWFVNGDKIRPDSHSGVYITKYRSFETKSLYSELIIERSDLSHRGKYLCRSSDLAIATLHVTILNSETNNKKRDYKGLRTDPKYKQLSESTGKVYGRQNSARSSSAFIVLIFTSIFISHNLI